MFHPKIQPLYFSKNSEKIINNPDIGEIHTLSIGFSCSPGQVYEMTECHGKLPIDSRVFGNFPSISSIPFNLLPAHSVKPQNINIFSGHQ